MLMINKTYRFRLYPSKEQEELLAKQFGTVRYVYNYFLNKRKEAYLSGAETENYYTQAKQLTELKKEDDKRWINDTYSQSLQYALRSLDTAYLDFYRKKKGMPRFKTRKSRNSFTLPIGGKISKGYLKVPKIKSLIKMIDHREIEGTICRMTITKEVSGKYFVAIVTQQQNKCLEPDTKSVGIDLGITDLLVTSDGDRFENNRYLKKYEKKLAAAQRHLARKTKGSNEYERQRLKVAKIHDKVSNSRMDTLHKLSKIVVDSNQVIAVESLDVKKMLTNKKLSKHIADASWGMFVTMLQYKSKWYERNLVKVDRYFPSSKTCGACGWIKQDLKLNNREWVCSACGTVHDRDINASRNILKEGYRILSSGIGDNKGEEEISPLVARSMKPQVIGENL